MHRLLGCSQLYFVVLYLVYWFISSCMMVNGTNINESNTFNGFKYLFNDWLLNAIHIIHVDLLSHVYQNDD